LFIFSKKKPELLAKSVTWMVVFISWDRLSWRVFELESLGVLGCLRRSSDFY
jgi:hypothetical protein